MSMTSGSEIQYSAMDIVDSLSYYSENCLNAEIPAGASLPSRRINWEASSTWRLLIEVFRMEALADRLRDQIGDDETNPIRDGFIRFPSFRRLMAIIRWVHWVTSQEAEEFPDAVGPSQSAYPHSGNMDGSELPIDTALTHPERINRSDLTREHNLCKQVWSLLTQGRVMDAVDLCGATGHHWRAGVLNAASGHIFMTEETEDEVTPDWVESVIVSSMFGLESELGKESGLARHQVKKTAREILAKGKTMAGIDEPDIAITAFLCGDEDWMRRVVPSNSYTLNLWVSLLALKEEFAAYLLGTPVHSSDRFQEGSDVETEMQDSIALIVSSLDTSMNLNSDNQFKLLQSDLIVGDYESAVSLLSEWVIDGIVRINHTEVDVDLESPNMDPNAVVMVRTFASSLATILRDLVAREKRLDESSISGIIVGNIECIVAQLKGSSGLSEGNQLVVENLCLLTEEGVKVKTWAWYIRQYIHEWPEWTVDNTMAFTPIVSLVESFPSGALAVIRLLLADSMSRRSESILTHSFGASIEAGKEIAFSLGCLNCLWIVVQSAAKSTGNGVYLDLYAGRLYEDPDEAASDLVTNISNLIGEGLLLLMLADFQAAKAVVALTRATPQSTSKLLSIQAAVDSVQSADEDSDVGDILGVVASFVQILERVTTVMERNSLLEQQRANMAKLSGRGKPQLTATSADARRQILEGQRLVDSTSEMIHKLVDEIVNTVVEYLKANECPIDPSRSAVSIEADVWKRIATSGLDVLIESCVQAVALVDDRKRQQLVLKSVESCNWVKEVVGRTRLQQVLEEIA